MCLGQKWNVAAISGLDVVNYYFPSLRDCKIIYTLLWRKTYSPPCNLFPADATSQGYWCFQIKCQIEHHSLLLPNQTFTARSCDATPTESNHSHFCFILNVRRKFHSERFFFSETTTLWNEVPCVFLYSLQESIVIYPPHSHNFHFLAYVTITLLTVNLYLEWFLSLVFRCMSVLKIY